MEFVLNPLTSRVKAGIVEVEIEIIRRSECKVARLVCEDYRDIELTVVLRDILEGISKSDCIPKRDIKDIVPANLKNRIKAHPGNAIARDHISPLVHVEAIVSRGEFDWG